MFCKKCGNELPDGAKFCELCGTEITQTVQEETETSATNQENISSSITENITAVQPSEFVNAKEKTIKLKEKVISSKKMTVIVAAALLLLVLGGIIIGRTISLNKYEKALKSAYVSITEGAELAESYATLESKVWRNCIYENSSSETDKYTKNKYGQYYDDFNDALSSFYDGESLTYSLVANNVTTVDKCMSDLKKCPKKFDDAYAALKQLYISYSDLTNLVVGSSSYSWTTFNEALETAKSDYKSDLSSARLLLE